MTDDVLELAARNLRRAREVAGAIGVTAAWESIGAKVNQVGSVRTGLLMKRRDIDFHIYSSPLRLSESFSAMARLAGNPAVRRIEFVNQMATEEECVEWHAWCVDRDGELWQVDMIHIQKGSLYDGYMEEVADRIVRALTPETRRAILQIKYDTPETEAIPGIEYCRAVLGDGVRTYGGFAEWRKHNPMNGVVRWMP